jgi:ubiquinone/menaquinone biosynthesis C-methylase UbiE
VAYVMRSELGERRRLQLQSRVWEAAGEQLLARLGSGQGLHVLEVGCGAMGWLRILSHWVGDTGQVTGTDVDDAMLAASGALCSEESLTNVTVCRDDIFASTLPEASFDLVHLRFQLAPIGRAQEQVSSARKLARPGGWIVLEEPDAGSWQDNPFAPATARLRSLVVEAFTRNGGDFNAGRRLPEYLRAAGVDPVVHSACLALQPGHPYLHLPIQFAASLRARLLEQVDEAELDRLMDAAGEELASRQRWGVTFTLIQAWGSVG